MNRTDLRDVIVVMGSLLLSMVTGFLRQTTLAFLIGAGRATDIFLVAYAVPEFIYVAIPIVLTPALIPIFMQIKTEDGDAAAWGWSRNLILRVTLILVAGAVLIGIFAPIIIRLLSPGFSEAERATTQQLLFAMLPAIVLMGLSALVGSILQVYRKFARPALTSAVFNALFIAGMFLLPISEPLQRTGWSVTLASLGALIFQLPLYFKLKAQFADGPSTRAYELSSAFKLMGWMTAGYAIHHLILFIDRAMATNLGEGAAAVLNFGYHLALTAGQIAGMAVSFVVFPTMAEAMRNNDREETVRTLRSALGVVLAIAIPAVLGMILFREEIVTILLEHGAFTRESTVEVSSTLLIYSIAVLFDSLCQPLWRLVYAARDGKSVVLVNGAQTAIRIIANLILVSLIGYQGIAWSAVIGLGVQLFLLLRLSKNLVQFKLDSVAIKMTIRLLAIGIISAVIALIVKGGIAKVITPAPRLLTLTAGGVVLLGMYALLVKPLYKNVSWTRRSSNE
ncbi:MAG TPA: lipid II flippase MurJ [Bellilinea sp.]|nr:lipid II flippase MurJ [Bellilinea sp.]